MKIKTKLYINGFILASLGGVLMGMLFLRQKIAAAFGLPGELLSDLVIIETTTENHLLILVVVLIIGSSLSLFILSRRLLHAVALFTRAAQTIGEGNFDYILPPVSNDELGEIVQVFQKVADQLRGAIRHADQERSLDKVLLASIGEGVIATDKDGTIIVVNEAAAEMLRCSTKELLGHRTVEVIPMEDQYGRPVPVEKRTIQLALAAGDKVFINHYFFIRKDKSKFPVAITATPVKLRGKIIGGIVVFHDVTKEKEVDQAKTEFVSLASHQLRTPLTAINWYIEMLLSGDAGPLTDDQKSFLQEVYKGSKRMIQIVNEFLNVARLESGRLKVDPKPIQLINFVQDIIDEVMPLANARNCEIIFTKLAESPPLIPLDSILMRQVVHNILTNALRYSPEGKCSIQVKLEKGPADNYIISVKDNGIGIPKVLQSRIFEKFFRTENAIQTVTEGSGIGLYISKMIVEASNAQIWFESEEGRGTTFYVSIPIQGSVKRNGVKELVPV